MLPPLHTSATRLPASRSRSSERRRERGCPRRLDQVSRLLDHRQERAADLVVADEHEVVELIPEDSLRELEGGSGRKSFGEGLHPIVDEPALSPGSIRGRRGSGLHADHFGRGLHGSGDDAGACRAASPADGHDDRVDSRLFFDDLECAGRHAGDQVRLVAGVDVAVAVLGCELLAVLARVVVVTAVDDELGAEQTHRLGLDRVCVLGNADRCLDAELPGRVGDRLAVVACRRRDHAASSVLVRRVGRRG